MMNLDSVVAEEVECESARNAGVYGDIEKEVDEEIEYEEEIDIENIDAEEISIT